MITHSPLALILIAILGIPLLWSAVLTAARSLAGSRMTGERAEKLLLALMVAPVAAGIGVTVLAIFFPSVAAPLPALVAVPAQPAISAGAAVPLPAPGVDWVALIAGGIVALYGTGVALLFARFVHARLRLREILNRALDAGAEWGPNVALTDAHVPPFASGRSRIILPRVLMAHLTPDQIVMIVRHEQAHLDRRDPALFLGLAMVEILLWHDPSIRRQVQRCRLAAELACDRLALEPAPSLRADYAKSLLLALKHSAGDAMFCASAVPNETMGDYEMRISEIMQPAGFSVGRTGRVTALAALLLAGPVVAAQAALADSAVPDRIADAPRVTLVHSLVSHNARQENRWAAQPNAMIVAGEPGAALRLVVDGKPVDRKLMAFVAKDDQASVAAKLDGKPVAEFPALGAPAGLTPPQPRGDPGSWTTVEDYPFRALSERASGTTAFHVAVSAEGRVSDCAITASSGSSELDAATCTLVTRRARFTPAQDDQGNNIVGSYSSAIVWQLPLDARVYSPLVRNCVSRFDAMRTGRVTTDANAMLVNSQCQTAIGEAPQKCAEFLTGVSRAGASYLSYFRSNWADAEKARYLAAVEVANASRGVCGV